jgi:hypothetical protein
MRKGAPFMLARKAEEYLKNHKFELNLKQARANEFNMERDNSAC